MDPEIKAMVDISEALSQLEPEAIRRILKWANERFLVKPLSPNASDRLVTEASETPTFTGFHDLFDAASPSTAIDKALVAAYWFQVVQGHEELDGFQLNKELKNLGHPSTNITRDLDSLMNRNPRLVMQIRKEGGSQQARKRYKLTTEGIRSVQRMISKKQTIDDSQNNS